MISEYRGNSWTNYTCITHTMPRFNLSLFSLWAQVKLIIVLGLITREEAEFSENQNALMASSSVSHRGTQEVGGMAAKGPLASRFKEDEQKGHASMGAKASASSVASANSPTAIPQGDMGSARGPDESSGRHGSGVAFKPTMSAPPTHRGRSTTTSKTSPE